MRHLNSKVIGDTKSRSPQEKPCCRHVYPEQMSVHGLVPSPSKVSLRSDVNEVLAHETLTPSLDSSSILAMRHLDFLSRVLVYDLFLLLYRWCRCESVYASAMLTYQNHHYAHREQLRQKGGKASFMPMGGRCCTRDNVTKYAASLR